MSSSDEEAVRGPGRNTSAGHRQSPSENEDNENAVGVNMNSMNGDDADDDDLFGSDGPDGELDNNEYGISLAAIQLLRR